MENAILIENIAIQYHRFDSALYGLSRYQYQLRCFLTDIYKVLGYSTVGDFERARTSEQKEARMAEIKKAASDLFDEVPYSEITLTTIAKRLSWTRANLYSQ